MYTSVIPCTPCREHTGSTDMISNNSSSKRPRKSRFSFCRRATPSSPPHKTGQACNGKQLRDLHFRCHIIQSLTPSNTTSLRTHRPLCPLNATRNAKQRRYNSLIATQSRVRPVHVSISNLVVRHHYSCEVLNEVARNLILRAMNTYGKFRVVFMQGHAAATVMSISACLMAF